MGQAQPRMTLEEFLAREAVQVERHEFVRGEVFAMVGARRVHGRVEAFRAAPVGWVLDDMSDGTVIRLDSLGLELSLAEVFAGLTTDGR